MTCFFFERVSRMEDVIECDHEIESEATGWDPQWRDLSLPPLHLFLLARLLLFYSRESGVSIGSRCLWELTRAFFPER